jgi:glutathione S-transferase
MVNYATDAATAPPRAEPNAEAGRVPVLWHLKASHYNEKARWALDHKRIPHIRRAAVPGRHAKIARELWGGETLPVLDLGDEVVGDSTRIIEVLEQRWPERPLYPDKPERFMRALELEEFFDEEFGPYIRRLLLHHMLPDRRLLFGAFVPDLSGARRLVASATYPLLRRRVVADFHLDEAGVEAAWSRCRAACERFAAELQANGYLAGNGFSVADLTVAALFSPVVAPEQFPYPQPQRGHPRFAALRAMLDEFGALEWTRGIYARHRPRSAEVLAPAT